MNRKITLSAILFAVLAVFSLSACTDEAAEAEMNRLKDENAVLQGQLDSLQKNLDSLNAYNDVSHEKYTNFGLCLNRNIMR